MTENEAKTVLEKANEQSVIAIEKLRAIEDEVERTEKVGEFYACLENCIREQEACTVAIQALEEIQQYRAIGTVAEVKYLIDSYNGMIHDFGDDMVALEAYKAIGTVEGYKRAIEVSKENYCLCREYKAKVQQYEAIGTVEEFETLKKIHSDCSIKNLTGECSYNETGCSGCKGREIIKTAVERMKPNPKTNADRIRAMSDEELAEFLVSVETHGYHDQSVAGTLEMIEWLKSEVEEKNESISM